MEKVQLTKVYFSLNFSTHELHIIRGKICVVRAIIWVYIAIDTLDSCSTSPTWNKINLKSKMSEKLPKWDLINGY